jgi:hypothetical protein
MVRSPSRRKSSPSGRTPVERNVSVGCDSTSKKSALRMWLSRLGSPVFTELRSTVAVTLDCSGSGAVTMVPSNLSKRPRTLLTIMCLTTKDTSECTGSIVHVPAT